MTEENNLCIGMIRLCARAHYEKTGEKLCFPDAKRRAMLTKPALGDPLGAKGETMTTDEFRDFIDRIPVGERRKPEKTARATERLPERFGNFYIREEQMFMAEDDVMAYVHIPYIFDGLHTHDHFEINYVYSGACTLRFDGCEETFGQGTLFLLAPDVPHNVYDEGESIIISIMIRKTTLDTAFSAVLRNHDVISRFFQDAIFNPKAAGLLVLGASDSPTTRRYMQNLMREFHEGDCYHNINAVCILSLVFTHLVRNNPAYTVRYDFSDSSAGHVNFAVLMEYIRQNYSTVTLRRLSERFHYSESFISRLITAQTGVGFAALVKKLKMEHARRLLEQSDMTLGEISDAVGYASQNHLSRVFKAYYGMPPAAYRQTARKT